MSWRPLPPLFSGWNCTPIALPLRTAARSARRHAQTGDDILCRAGRATVLFA